LKHDCKLNPLTREFFGPVALFFRVKKEPEAIDLANTGMVFINHPTWTTADLPFGGVKNSGYGRDLSSLGIHEFITKELARLSEIDDPA
jgi:succinate-semialdehyde dehydrogenase / glutarate-semialdehyde dehydrogenase